jgi:hypothetical protein
MRHFMTCACTLGLLGTASRQNPARPTAPVTIAPAGTGARLDPVILTQASLDDGVVTLRMIPRVATSIRMPEPVNSVVIGDPEHFQAEHSEREPELVTVRPVSTESGQSGGTQTVDFLLKYGKPAGGRFLVEESPVSALLIAETQRLDGPERLPDLASAGAKATSLAELVKTSSADPSGGIDEKSGAVIGHCSTGKKKHRSRPCTDSVRGRSKPDRE